MVQVSILTPVYNAYRFTEQYLKELSNLGQEHEIILVDNGSTDKTTEILAKYEEPTFHICLSDTLFVWAIKNSENKGFAVASNQAYQKATGDIIIFLNNDIKVHPNHLRDWTQTIVRAIWDNPDALVGPTGGYVDPHTYNFQYHCSSEKQKFNYLSGWCLAGRKVTFEKLRKDNGEDAIGPFYDFGTYFEDTYMGFRATSLGISMKIIDVPIVHFGMMTSRQMNTNKMFAEARVRFIKKMKESGYGR